MTCRSLTELITEYLDGRLTTRQWLAFQWHLGFCRDCRRYLRQMRHTVRVLGRMPAAAPSPEVLRELLARFRDWGG
jgi:predicted anti-sigma-YlaC factor YlaD